MVWMGGGWEGAGNGLKGLSTGDICTMRLDCEVAASTMLMLLMEVDRGIARSAGVHVCMDV